MNPVVKDLAIEASKEGLRAFISWMKERAKKMAKWRWIQEHHVERRDLSNDPRPKP